MRSYILAVVLSLLVPISTRAASPCSTPACRSADAGIAHLAEVMDEFHNRFPVYDDLGSSGNHFHAFAAIPNERALVRISGGFTENPHSGATAIRTELDPATPGGFGGFYFLNGVLPPGETSPRLNFGTVPNAGINLQGATALTFWARGSRGRERVQFFVAGVGWNPDNGMRIVLYPDSNPVIKTTVVLSRRWTKYRLDLTGKNLSYVLGGFGWAASTVENPAGIVIFLDDIMYELGPARLTARLNEPRLLRSFRTLPFQRLPDPVGDFDFVLRNTAFTYDNALAALAFLAHGSPDSVRRARLIGDAFIYASRHDRTFTDRRLRDAYAAGDIALPPGWTPNGKARTVPIPGFFDEDRQTFFEVEQAGMSTGNNAWALLALLALHRETGEPRYLAAAVRIGHFIQNFKAGNGTYLGFRGGIDDPEAVPKERLWASTEHNLDVFAAFSTLAQQNGAPSWLEGANHARQFVEAMWHRGRRCILTGTLDPSHRNENAGQLPVDVQAWSVLALPEILTRHPGLLACAERNHRTKDQGFTGFDFNEDRDGVWFEGTAHMAVAYALAGRETEAELLRAVLRRAQSIHPFGDGKGIAATAHDGLSSGFGFRFFRRLHVGATAWNVFAQLRFNPFYGVPVAPEAPRADRR
jgi:hypothetical protein